MRVHDINDRNRSQYYELFPYELFTLILEKYYSYVEIWRKSGGSPAEVVRTTIRKQLVVFPSWSPVGLIPLFVAEHAYFGEILS